MRLLQNSSPSPPIALGIRQSQRDPDRRLAPSLRVLTVAVIVAVLLCDAFLKTFGHGFREFNPDILSAAVLIKIIELSSLWWLTLRSKPTNVTLA